MEYPYLYSYLIHTTNEYTGESLKAYKSLASYKYVKSGWVSDVKAIPIPGSEAHLVMASVRHSQKISVSPVRSWVVVKKKGTILYGHCTCMAGLGEVCSHIGAVLFALEANTRYKESLTCTSVPCSWLPPIFQNVEYAPVASINFSNSASAAEEPKKKKSKTAITSATPEELDTFLNKLSTSGSKAVVLSVTPNYCDGYKLLSSTEILPRPLDHLFTISNMGLSYPDLLSKCESIYEDYKITASQAKNVELHTRKQAASRFGSSKGLGG